MFSILLPLGDRFVTSNGKRNKILSIDDEFAALIKMKIMLSDYGECDTATTANQALNIFNTAISAKAPFTLITFDIEMPEITGVELMKKIHDLEEKAGIKPSYKIMVSASSTPENVKASMQNSCSAFLVKPIKRKAIDEALHRLNIEKIGHKLDHLP